MARLQRSADFYEHVLGLSALYKSERLSALRVVPGQVLLLIRKGADVEPTVLPFGTLPPSDGQGQLHVAFAIAHDELDQWRQTLEGHGVEIESRARRDNLAPTIDACPDRDVRAFERRKWQRRPAQVLIAADSLYVEAQGVPYG